MSPDIFLRRRRLSRPLYWLLPLVLAGCAGFSADGGMERVSALSQERTGHKVSVVGTESRKERLSQLLSAALTPDSATEIALLNNKRLQVALADLGIAESDLVQAGRLRNPGFSFGRLSGDGDTEIERAILFDLTGLLTLPLRRAIEEKRFGQAQLQTALQAVRTATDARRAYFQAVAAQQTLRYLEQADLAAQASAELAQRMAKAGNWGKLEEAREQAFRAEVAAQLTRAGHAARATRERLVRLLGLSDEHASLRLPDRLPDLPAVAEPVDRLESRALGQRLDVQAAKLETESTARSLGLTRATRFVNVLEAGYQNKSSNGASRADGYEVELSLPLFDWGAARVRRAEAIYMRSLQRTADVAVQARSEVRELHSAYQSSYLVARQYRDEIVPTKKRVSDEVLLRYNGMLASVFELLADARSQIASINAAIDSHCVISGLHKPISTWPWPASPVLPRPRGRPCVPPKRAAPDTDRYQSTTRIPTYVFPKKLSWAGWHGCRGRRRQCRQQGGDGCTARAGHPD